MLRHFDERGKRTWASTVRIILQSHGLGYIRMIEEVGNEMTFICMFNQRVQEIDSQNWESKIKESKVKYIL